MLGVALALVACSSGSGRPFARDASVDDGSARDAAIRDSGWLLRDASSFAPMPDDAGSTGPQPCTGRTSRTRPDVPELLRAYPHRMHPVVAGDGPLLAIAYADEVEPTLRFVLVSAETGTVEASFGAERGPDGIAPVAIRRRDADTWEVLWVAWGVFAGIDVFSRTSGAISRVRFRQPEVEYAYLGVAAPIDSGFAWVSRRNPDRAGHEGPFLLLLLSADGSLREHVIDLPVDDYAIFQAGRAVSQVRAGVVAGLAEASDASRRTTTRIAFTMEGIDGDAPRTTTRLLGTETHAGYHGAQIRSTAEGLVLNEWEWRHDAGDATLRYTWLTDDLAPIATWSATLAGTAGFSGSLGAMDVAGRFPTQALVTVAQASDYGSVLLGLASAPGEVAGGLTSVATGASPFAIDGAVWESSPRGYSLVYWRAGLEIVTFRCEEP